MGLGIVEKVDQHAVALSMTLASCTLNFSSAIYLDFRATQLHRDRSLIATYIKSGGAIIAQPLGANRNPLLRHNAYLQQLVQTVTSITLFFGSSTIKSLGKNVKLAAPCETWP